MSCKADEQIPAVMLIHESKSHKDHVGQREYVVSTITKTIRCITDVSLVVSRVSVHTMYHC